jgi:hypothetical protein
MTTEDSAREPWYERHPRAAHAVGEFIQFGAAFVGLFIFMLESMSTMVDEAQAKRAQTHHQSTEKPHQPRT